jgi:hypothetical protein
LLAAAATFILIFDETKPNTHIRKACFDFTWCPASSIAFSACTDAARR